MLTYFNIGASDAPIAEGPTLLLIIEIADRY